jgi:hypothetical protein
MGMDVYGKKPTNPKGEYFRANVWYWRPLWEYVHTIKPELTDKVESPHYNDGSGLNAKDSRTLSQLLLKDIDSGKTEQYISDYMQAINDLPLEDCSYCNQTGFREWSKDGAQVQKVCNACNGQLKLKSWECNYPMHIDVVKEFQQFLYYCGGFNIY